MVCAASGESVGAAENMEIAEQALESDGVRDFAYSKYSRQAVHLDGMLR